MIVQKMQIENAELFLKLFYILSKEIRNKKYYEENRENLKKAVRFRLNINVRKEREDSWLFLNRVNPRRSEETPFSFLASKALDKAF